MAPQTSIVERWRHHARVPSITRAPRRLARLSLAVPFLLLSVCATSVPPTVTWGPAQPIDRGPKVFVNASSQGDAVHRAMKQAGFNTVKTSRDANYVLQVNIGNSRGSGTNACGSINNVAFILSSSQQRVLVIKGRGPTGGCDPNILNDTSLKLATFF